MFIQCRKELMYTDCVSKHTFREMCEELLTVSGVPWRSFASCWKALVGLWLSWELPHFSFPPMLN